MNAEARRIWDANAAWWDDRIGDGNDFQTVLIEPAMGRLLGDVAGQTVLDVGCGAGRFARQLAERGATVTAGDFSTAFLARARERTPAALPVTYQPLDATDPAALRALGTGGFDAVTAVMMLMDLATLAPLFQAIPALLKPGGRFVFCVSHPCFHTVNTHRFVEDILVDGRCTARAGVTVTGYLTPTAVRGEGIVGQPETQYYFDRPLSLLFDAGFRAGLTVTGLEEPAFPTVENRWRLHWPTEIPPVLAVRMGVK